MQIIHNLGSWAYNAFKTTQTISQRNIHETIEIFLPMIIFEIQPIHIYDTINIIIQGS